MITTWQDLQARYPELFDVLQPGIQKLKDYRDISDLTPAYILSMGERHFIFSSILVYCLLVIDPKTKLRWFEKYVLEKLPSIRKLFLDSVSVIFCLNSMSNRFQLKPYATNTQDTTSEENVSLNWEDNVLGLDDAAAPQAYQDLEAEINAYLLHTARPTTAISFWQVSLITAL